MITALICFLMPITTTPRINIFPTPESVIQMAGQFHFRKHVEVYSDDGCRQEAETLREALRPGGIGVDVRRATGRSEREGAVYLEIAPKLKTLGPEGYELVVTSGAVKIRSSDSAGVFYGIQTLRQMLPSETEDAAEAPDAEWSVPCAEITDRPRFPWRGMLLDVSRHFFPKKDIFRFLDFLAMEKMNVFHWHLTDDGGWRLEIKKYPKLTQVGAWRKPSRLVWDYQNLTFPGPTPDEALYGGFYTQDDVREIVAYAAKRHIQVVPEIEMPGHSLAALASYPELTCSGVSATAYKAESGYPSPNVYCAGKEKTFQFLQDVIDEVAALFPSPYIHIGGDEVDKTLWKACPDCQKRMADEGLKTPEELQSYFIKRIETYINSKGKRMIGWDEILEGGLAPNATVMSWRGIDGGVAAAQSGHDVIMTPTSHCYFDYLYDNISTEHVLGFDPVPAALKGDTAKHVLGGQCNLWTEYVPDLATAEQRLFPRILSMAEVLWSEKPERDPDAFDARLQPEYARLLAMGINFYLPKPAADVDAILLSGPSSVTFAPTTIPGAEIRYTTDGSEPEDDSPLCSGPIRVEKPGVVSAALFLNGRRSEVTKVAVAAYQPQDVKGLVPGLSWTVYDGKFEKLSAWDKLTAAATGSASSVKLVGDRKENYALQVTGFIKIARDGLYRFFLYSDDGSALWLGGARLVDNDGLHGDVEKSGSIRLKAGLYPLTVGYFQAGGAQTLSASIEGPDLKKRLIPASMLWRVKDQKNSVDP